MSLTLVTNLVVMILCAAVLVQSVRMMRSFKVVRDTSMKQTVETLDHATARARHVLADMKELLAKDCAANARVIAEGKEILDELSVMIGIGNSVAERIVEASGRAHAPVAEPMLLDEAA